MTRHFAGTSDHMDGSSPAFTAKPGAIGAWRYAAAQPGQTDVYAHVSDGTTANRFQLGADITAASGKVAAVVNTLWQGLTTAVPSNNTWHYHLASFSTANVAAAYTDQGSKGTAGSVGTPTGINHQQIGGRGASDLAYVSYYNRVPNDVEEAYLGAGGNPRNLPNLVNWYYVTASSGTETDRFGSANLTVTGTSAAISSGPPPVASFWTATAQGNQSATQGGTFPAIDLTTKFEQLSGSVDWTGTLLQVGAAGTPLSANGAAASASNLLTVTGTVPAAGSLVSIAGAAKTPVLFVSGQTLLLGSSQTWNNADSVTPYPVSAPTGLTSNGYTITANLTGGTVGAGAVGTYPNCLYCATNNSNGALIAYSALHTITVASSGAAPSFSAGPTLTGPTTDGYVFSATSNQTATWYGVAMLRGSTAPTGAQVKAGSPTGFVSRFTTALTASVAGTLTYTGLTLPVYDLYQVVDNGSGTSAVSSFTNQMKSPPAGKQYVSVAVQSITAITKAVNAKVTVTAHGRANGDWVEHYGIAGMTQMNGVFDQVTVFDANNYTLNHTDSTGFSTYTSGGVSSWGQSIYANASTSAVSGDIGIVDQVTTPGGLSIQVGPNGYLTIAGGGINARQTYSKDFYSVSAQAVIGLATDYLQDVPPVAPVTPDVPFAIFLPANQSIASVDLRGLGSDPQGDPLTATLTPVPAGTSVASSILSGTTGSSSITLGTLTLTNASGDSSTAPVNTVVGKILPPNLVGLTQGEISGLLGGYYMVATFGAQNNAAPAGTAIAQNPVFGVPLDPNTTINVTLSTGVIAPTFVAVPDVSSVPIDQATAVATITTAGLVAQVAQPWTGSVQIRQIPPANSQVVQGSLVYLFLLGGSPTQRRKPAPKKRAVIPPPKPRPRVIIKVPK